jgi:peroxiredoxin
MTPVRRTLLAAVALLLSGPALISADDPAPPAKSERTVKDFALKDSAGRTRTPAEWRGGKAAVLVFLGTECPVSNGYSPELTRLAKAFAARGVVFWGIHSDPTVTADAAARHAADYKLGFPILLDPAQCLARATGVKVVPEAVVLTPGGVVLYRGRIDDKYSPDGKRRDEPRTRDLEAAVEAVLAGKEPVPAAGAAFGCPLPEPARVASD